MRQLVVVALWLCASAVSRRLQSPFLPWPCEEGMSDTECNEVRQCEILTRVSQLASNVRLDCDQLGDCVNSDLIYCSPQACRNYNCGSDPACILNFLPFGIACAWQCRPTIDDSDSAGDTYNVNCLTGELIDIPTPPTTKSPSDPSTYSEGDAPPPTTYTTSTTYSEVPAGLPTTVACVGIVGGAAGMGFYFLAGGSTGTIAPEIVTEPSFQDLGPSRIDDFEAVEIVQDDLDLNVENKLENMFETVQGANEEKIDVASKLLQMSEGEFSSGEGGVLSSEIANKFLEDVIGPFYK
eukprot:Protomagalhaensia_wolfi_Nauph_80__6331@NODE_987_length_1827_cov_670_296421_g696_i1_p1_GENE_NODE_987_length_1827_cov_670_296421_g696_i1NODE_987_length_1827_cov_670_296421_g696_i1_p1_ORF_typecomplete_len295_score58_46GRIM19/PF06212_12/0_33_NODE_987_length_1827_cov_670_296421_g696_i12241108